MRRAAEAIRDLFFYKTLQPSRERLQPFVMLKIAMGGMAGAQARRPPLPEDGPAEEQGLRRA